MLRDQHWSSLPRQGGDSNFLIPNATFIAELVAFAILLWLLNKYVLPPLTKAMTDRQDLIDRQIKDSVEAQGAARGRRGGVSRAARADQGRRQPHP